MISKKITFIGGGSQSWGPHIVRDIIFKEGLNKVKINMVLHDIHEGRAKAIKKLFDAKLAEWKADWAKVTIEMDVDKALKDADFVLIAISTGRLEAMRHDLDIPEKYGIYHTVGDSSGPGGWARALRNIPVFKSIAQKVKKLAPNAYVLNYTNPMATLTKVLSDELGQNRVVGLCHGYFGNMEVLKAIFDVKEDKDISMRFGGMNHFFWILDMQINGQDGYKLLREKLKGSNFATIVDEVHTDAMGFSSDKWLTGELLSEFGYLPYVGDRHTCEFLSWGITNKDTMEKLKIKRTTIEDRYKGYEAAEKRIAGWTEGKAVDAWGEFTKIPSRETAADIIKAITFNTGFVDVINVPNIGQIPNLPMGAVVETLGYVESRGFTPLTVGPLPEPIRALCAPHAEVNIRTVDAALSGDKKEALLALAADPICAHLPINEVKKMGMELMEAHREFLPDSFFKK